MADKMNGKKEFPKTAMGIFILILIALAVYEMLTFNANLTAREETLVLVTGGVVGSLGGVIGGLIGLSIQYALIKFPTQWLSKEEDVYKNEIWEAIFYSSSAGVLINFILAQRNVQVTILVSASVSILMTSLFLLIYFSGKTKESHIKRAITIVQVLWILLGLGLEYILSMFVDVSV